MRRKTASVFAALVVLVLAAPGPAVAQSDEGVSVDDFTEDQSVAAAVLDGIGGFVSGLTSRLRHSVSEAVGEDHTDLEATVGDATSYYNDRSTAFEGWANERVDADTSRDVVKLTFEDEGETETRYLVADVNNSEYQNSEIVTSTDRSVDETCTVSGLAAQNADAELETFYDEFVSRGESISAGYASRMKGQYDDDVDCSLLG